MLIAFFTAFTEIDNNECKECKDCNSIRQVLSYQDSDMAYPNNILDRGIPSLKPRSELKTSFHTANSHITKRA